MNEDRLYRQESIVTHKMYFSAMYILRWCYWAFLR